MGTASVMGKLAKRGSGCPPVLQSSAEFCILEVFPAKYLSVELLILLLAASKTGSHYYVHLTVRSWHHCICGIR